MDMNNIHMYDIMRKNMLPYAHKTTHVHVRTVVYIHNWGA